MNILLTGSNGQLGWELMNQSKAFGFEMKGVDLPQLDISDSVQVRDIVANYRPSLVINAAAYTNVDGAETEKDLAFSVNRDAPAYLAELCSNESIPLIHFSTDYVFNGNKKTPYKETDHVSPLNIYGQSKLEGEIKIRSTLKEHIIFRTAWLYGIYGHNFVKTILGLGREKESIQVVEDQYGSPTSAIDLSETVLTIVSKIQNKADIEWGTYHYCGQGTTSWHGFAEAIFDIAKHITSLKVQHVEPVRSDAFASKATRPDFSTLDCQRIKKHFGIHTKPWRQSLEIMINRLFNE